jgi:hypothetical protein
MEPAGRRGIAGDRKKGPGEIPPAATRCGQLRRKIAKHLPGRLMEAFRFAVSVRRVDRPAVPLIFNQNQ